MFSNKPNEILSQYVEPLGDGYCTVCWTSSDEYVPILCSSIKSLIDNISVDKQYDLVVMSTDMSVVNKTMITNMVSEATGVSIRFIDVSGWVDAYNFHTWAHFKAYTYYRLLIPTLFKKYKKVVYLDSDTIVCKDIYDLFEIDIDSYMLAAAYDTHVMGRLNNPNPEDLEYYLGQLQIGDSGYFQAGVILFNIQSFNSRYSDDELIIMASQTKYLWLDQDFLNVICRGKVKFLPNHWNVMVLNNGIIDEEYLPEQLYQDYVSARVDPSIIHYIGRSVPCFKPMVEYQHLFWKYAKQTPYYEQLIYKMIIENEFSKLKDEYGWIITMCETALPKESRRYKLARKVGSFLSNRYQ